ncbi:MAG: DUF4231 domain-containing protein [Chloroflexi bacterium]|nr:DUF4231 domain-containing protein [Chloroflexota bacterium]
MSDPQTNLNIKTTQTVKAVSTKAEEKSKLFFFRRMPRRDIPREWTKPDDEKEYETELLNEGFVSEALLKGQMSEELKIDLRELNQHLLPHFWRVNQRAKFYQNRYYQYQWAFILAAFFTTVFASMNVFAYAQGWTDSVNLIAFRFHWSEFLGLATALISGVAAAVSFLDANQTPQKRWFRARAQAEALRSTYFLYLARQEPFNTLNTGERVQIMRQRVIEVLRQARTGSADQAATYVDVAALTDEEEEAESAEREAEPPPPAADHDTPTPLPGV